MYNNDSNSLDTGAPDIRLTGNQRMASASDPMAEANDIALDMFGKPYHELTPPELELFNEEMLRLMQKVRAPQQNSGIMAAGPGTYTQNRKQMMAGGGIAGLEKRQGYFLGDLVRKIKDDIIPNELKENPVLTAALIGGGINQFGLPDFLTESMGMGSDVGQNWLGNLLGRDLVLGDTGMFEGGSDKPDLINFGNLFGTKDVSTAEQELLKRGIGGGDYEGEAYGTKSIADYIKEGVLGSTDNQGFKLTDPSTWMGGITNAISSAASPYLGEGTSRRVNPLYPLGIGAAVGKYVSGFPKD